MNNIKHLKFCLSFLILGACIKAPKAKEFKDANDEALKAKAPVAAIAMKLGVQVKDPVPQVQSSWSLKSTLTENILTKNYSFNLLKWGKKLRDEKSFRQEFHSELKNIAQKHSFLATKGFHLNSSDLQSGKNLSLTIASYKNAKLTRPYNPGGFSAYLKQKTTGSNKQNDNRNVSVGPGYRSFWSRKNGTFLMIPTKKSKNSLDFSKEKYDDSIDNFWKEVGENIIRFSQGKIPAYNGSGFSTRKNFTLGAHTGSSHGQTIFHFHFRFQRK